MMQSKFAQKLNIIQQRCALLGISLLTVVCLAGCPDPNSQPDVSVAPTEPEFTEYPLRVWIAADVADVSRIERQWLAGSDQPIELSVLQPAQLLNSASCDCDLLIFPSRLMGEMVHREWIVRLPTAVLEADASLEEELAGSPPAAESQTRYGGDQFAVSLGCSVPVVVGSQSLADKVVSPVAWDELLAHLEPAAAFDLPTDNSIDRQALVDRYLAIVATLAERNPNYGILFELQTMSPRLSKPEFVKAAQILKNLSLQPGGALALVGTHDAAWDFVTQHTGPAIAIASHTMLKREAAEAKSGSRLNIVAQGNLQGWNVGGGLLAALAADCRQSSLTNGMLKWLRQKKTRNSIAAVVAGVEAASPESGADSLSWQVRSDLAETLANANLPQEPRLYSAETYRDALATELLNMLEGSKTVEDALSDAAQAWSSITRQSEADVQVDYENSLGLTL